MSEKHLLVDELHAPARRNFPRRHVTIHEYDDLWQNVIKMRSYTRFNRSYYYILTVIDMLSKHTWVELLKVKNRNKMMKAFEKIIRDDGRCSKNLHIEKGI